MVIINGSTVVDGDYLASLWLILIMTILYIYTLYICRTINVTGLTMVGEELIISLGSPDHLHESEFILFND